MALSDVGPYVVKCAPPLWARDKSRERRKRVARARTLNLRRISRWEVRDVFEPHVEAIVVQRPKTRADCANVPRPCPFVSCRHHLYLDVLERTGNLKFNFPELEVDEMKDSCSLDIADEGGSTLERTAEAMNLTRERVRQIEYDAERRAKHRLPMYPVLRELLEK